MSGEWEQLALQCLLAFVSASHYAQGFMQSRDQEHNGLLVSSLCYPATLPTTSPDSCYVACYRVQHADFIACIGNQLAKRCLLIVSEQPCNVDAIPRKCMVFISRPLLCSKNS